MWQLLEPGYGHTFSELLEHKGPDVSSANTIGRGWAEEAETPEKMRKRTQKKKFVT